MLLLQVERVIQEVLVRHGRIDGVVNCVGSVTARSALATDLQELRETVDVCGCDTAQGWFLRLRMCIAPHCLPLWTASSAGTTCNTSKMTCSSTHSLQRSKR